MCKFTTQFIFQRNSDQSVFSDGITIDDSMSVLVKYQNQVQRAADHRAGAMSILTDIAGNISIQ